MGNDRVGVGPVVFRLDAGEGVGGGHASRCAAVASALREGGVESLFVVSREESLGLVGPLGFRCEVLSSNYSRLTGDDARALLALCGRVGARCLLVDTYGATRAFERELASRRPEGLVLAAFDDQYSYELGILDCPMARPYDVVINYGFFADTAEYGAAYAGAATLQLLGPRYAPLRPEFAEARALYTCSLKTVTDVLVTTGVTNPCGWLERLALACAEALDPNVRLHVVVGAGAEFELEMGKAIFHKRLGARGMAELMGCCQLAVSAAGSTLYELACLGVPAIAVSIVENQERNAEGFERRGLGIAVGRCFVPESLCRTIKRLATDNGLRSLYAAGGRDVIDGIGTGRIASALFDEFRK